MKSRLQTVLSNLLLAGIYFVAAKAGLLLAFDNASATAVWPPTGIALAAILLFGFRLSSGVFLGALLANLATTGPASLGTSVGIAIGNTLESVVGAWLVIRLAGGRNAFSRTQTIFCFIALAAGASTMVSATIGVASLQAGGHVAPGTFGDVWLTWWIGDMASDVIIAPLILIWKPSPAPRWMTPTAVEFAALMALVLLAGQAVFGNWITPNANYALEHLTIPPVLWAAWRFGLRGASTAALALSIVAMIGTLQDHGPFAVENRNEALVLVGVFMATITVTADVLASVVSERQVAEQALRDAQKQLEAHAQELEATVAERTAELREAISDLEAFSYSVSHDLRAPLRVMRQYSEALLEDYGERVEDRGRDFLRRIAIASERLDTLIFDLLEYNRVVRSKVRFETVNLEKLVVGVIKNLPDLRRFRERIRIERPLAAVVGNEAFLTQCLSNLLGNAVKFVKTGEQPAIVVRTEQRNAKVRIWVEDNGIGIDPQHQARIFGIFERLHGQMEYEGTGIGLAIVRKAVERMDGTVGFESTPGDGAKFWLELPAAGPVH